jgi:hypothetical protein
MSHGRLPSITTLAALAFLAGCGDSPGGPSSSLSDQELVGLMVAASAGSQNIGTAPCPSGGDATSAGTSESSTSGDIMTFSFDVTVAYHSCGYPLEQRTITLDGQTSINGLIRVQHPASGPSSLLGAEYHYQGTLRWRGEDVDVTCAVQIASTFEPQANRYTVVGRVCGRDVSQSIQL